MILLKTVQPVIAKISSGSDQTASCAVLVCAHRKCGLHMNHFDLSAIDAILPTFFPLLRLIAIMTIHYFVLTTLPQTTTCFGKKAFTLAVTIQVVFESLSVMNA